MTELSRQSSTAPPSGKVWATTIDLPYFTYRRLRQEARRLCMSPDEYLSRLVQCVIDDEVLGRPHG